MERLIELNADVGEGGATLRTLVAAVVGSERPEEAIAIASHVQEPGAGDNASGIAGTGPNFPYGPYVVGGLPPNPWIDDPELARSVAAASTIPPKAAEGSAGWLYDEATGQVWPNHDDYLTE